MSLSKVAANYRARLNIKEASPSFIGDLQKIMQLSSALSKSFEIYDPAYDAAAQLSGFAYRVWEMANKPTGVIPAQVFATHLDKLKRMTAYLMNKVETPNDKAKVTAIQNYLNRAVPVDVGTAYKAPEKEEDPAKLQAVVDKLLDKHEPKLDYFGETFGPDADKLPAAGLAKKQETEADPEKLNQVVKSLNPNAPVPPDYFGETF